MTSSPRHLPSTERRKPNSRHPQQDIHPQQRHQTKPRDQPSISKPNQGISASEHIWE